MPLRYPYFKHFYFVTTRKSVSLYQTNLQSVEFCVYTTNTINQYCHSTEYCGGIELKTFKCISKTNLTDEHTLVCAHTTEFPVNTHTNKANKQTNTKTMSIIELVVPGWG